MKVLITGADGFIGKNLQVHLAEHGDVETVRFTREHVPAELPTFLRGVDFIFHLAGVNRPENPDDFSDNVCLTQALCAAVADTVGAHGKAIPVIYASSTMAAGDTPYGTSKRAAEAALFALRSTLGVPVHVFRLPNVFGKWCRPNYNSAVATFCHNVARGLPIRIDDPEAPLTLAYVDDVVACFLRLMAGAEPDLDEAGFALIAPRYSSTVGQLANQIEAFAQSRESLLTEPVGTGLARALYATYVSYLPVEAFTYPVKMHGDARGTFVEMLKTPNCGQFSYFTAHPGVTRGGHYHHTKTEKFLVIKGAAHFKFRHIQTGEFHEVFTSGDKAEIVETVPGWTHDITNIGNEEMLVMLWANEIFDPARPDTIACPL